MAGGLPQVQVQDVPGVEDCCTLEDIIPVAEEGGEGEAGGGLDHLDTSGSSYLCGLIQNCTRYSRKTVFDSFTGASRFNETFAF